jgi:tetratricopeptide (TPR) repeat protein
MVVACASGPIIIHEDITAEELIQRGHEASDRNRYSVSLQYYQAIIERFVEDFNNIGNICAAEYEIAFIHYKQKRYEQAKTEFMNLLARYDTPDEELLPSNFKILSQRVIDTIAEIEEHRHKRIAADS